jgi:hypothetical protein
MQLNPSWEDRPTSSSISQEILTFIEIGSFIIGVKKNPSPPDLLWARSVQFTRSHPVSLWYTLILPSYIRPGLSSAFLLPLF